MNYKTIIHSEAKRELEKARDYYKEIEYDLALSFLENADTQIKIIKENPFLFQVKYKNYREVLLKKIPFIIIYEVEKEVIYVDSVFHTSKNPINKP